MTVRNTFSIINDTLNGIVNPGRLEIEFLDSTISSATLERIITKGDALHIECNVVLSAPDETTLTTLVSNHTGGPPTDIQSIINNFKESADFKELVFDVDEVLTDIDIYTDDTKTTKIFNKKLTYDGSGVLIQTILTRVSDSIKITSDFLYINGNLDAIMNSINE